MKRQAAVAAVVLLALSGCSAATPSESTSQSGVGNGTVTIPNPHLSSGSQHLGTTFKCSPKGKGAVTVTLVNDPGVHETSDNCTGTLAYVMPLPIGDDTYTIRVTAPASVRWTFSWRFSS